MGEHLRGELLRAPPLLPVFTCADIQRVRVGTLRARRHGFKPISRMMHLETDSEIVPRVFAPGRKCATCGTDRTPQWRTGANGTVVCNACGLKWKHRIKSMCSSIVCGACGHEKLLSPPSA